MSPQLELEIVGLSDSESARRAEAAIRNNAGVEAVRMYPARGRAFVEITRGARVEHLLESLESAGFMARPAREEAD